MVRGERELVIDFHSKDLGSNPGAEATRYSLTGQNVYTDTQPFILCILF